MSRPPKRCSTVRAHRHAQLSRESVPGGGPCLDFEVLHRKRTRSTTNYDRKSELQHQTHYCPGCGHGITHKLSPKPSTNSASRTDRTRQPGRLLRFRLLLLRRRQCAGRARPRPGGRHRHQARPARTTSSSAIRATATSRRSARPRSSRGEPRRADHRLLHQQRDLRDDRRPDGAHHSDRPEEHHVAVRPQRWNEGYPLHVSEVLSSLEAPVYIERVALGNIKQIIQAAKAIRKAMENQGKGLGFSLIEVLSRVPTIWKMQPVDAQKWVREELTKIYPLGVFRDRTKDAEVRPAPAGARPRRVRTISLPASPPLPRRGVSTSCVVQPTGLRRAPQQAVSTDFRIKIAGFGGQGVLMLGQVMAEAGLDAGLNVSWLPSYGPEMRSGTSNCHVRISRRRSIRRSFHARMCSSP